MTLHDAIVALLSEVGKPMSTREIAEELNRRGTYQKRDGSSFTPFQIHGRTKNYPALFERNGTTVSLRKWDSREALGSRTANSSPKSAQDRLGRKPVPRGRGEQAVLEKYARTRNGLFITEVAVSLPDTETDETPLESRRIDAVRVLTGHATKVIPHKSFDETAKLIKGYRVELIEVKKELNRSVIGQVVVGRDFFKHRYNHWDIEMVILTKNPRQNPSLRKWCNWNYIRVDCPE